MCSFILQSKLLYRDNPEAEPRGILSIKNRSTNNELIFQSDRGVQYACHLFRKELKTNKVQQRMSRKDNCWDNAVAENFKKL